MQVRGWDWWGFWKVQISARKKLQVNLIGYTAHLIEEFQSLGTEFCQCVRQFGLRLPLSGGLWQRPGKSE